MLQVATRKPTRHSRGFDVQVTDLPSTAALVVPTLLLLFPGTNVAHRTVPTAAAVWLPTAPTKNIECSCFTQRLIQGGNMSLIRCAILISTSFVFLAWSPSTGFSDFSTSLIALSEGGDPEDEGDDDDGFLAARVAQGFA